LNPDYYDSLVSRSYQEYLTGIPLDYWIRFEHYEDDFFPLAHAFGRLRAKIRHENGSKDTQGKIDPKIESRVVYRVDVIDILMRPYRELYTSRAKALVEMKYRADLDYFNYAF